MLQIRFAELRKHFHLAALRHAEQHAAARTDDLAGFDLPCEDEARGRRDDVEPPVARHRFLILRLRDAYPRLRRIAGRALAVPVGLRDEAADRKSTRLNSSQ